MRGAVLALALWPLAALAQPLGFPVFDPDPAPILIIDQERLLRESLYGREVLRIEDEEASALRAEGQALDRQFEAEERALTEQRETLDPAEFRVLADAFDEKVVATRREQAEKAAALTAAADRRRAAFFSRVGPILLTVLEETGAAAVVDERSVLIAKEDLNITDEVIKRLDADFRSEQAASADGEEEE